MDKESYGGELELVLLSIMLKQRLRLFKETEVAWVAYAEYGVEGPVKRMRFRPRSENISPHYDLIVPREAWTVERQLIEKDIAARLEAESRVPVKDVPLGNTRAKAVEESESRQQQTRQNKLKEVRSRPALAEQIQSQSQDTQELLEMMAGSPELGELRSVSPLPHPTRVRNPTRLYQSEQEEAAERASRQTEKAGKALKEVQRKGPVLESGEAVSHDWKEGERLGEASNPGPPTASGGKTKGGKHNSSSSSSQTNHMIKKPIGTPGNDGQPSAEDLRPGWLARSQPESLHRARRGYPGVHVDHRRGVDRHAVKQRESGAAHGWYLGTRVGEAQNPGPKGRRKGAQEKTGRGKPRSYAEVVRHAGSKGVTPRPVAPVNVGGKGPRAFGKGYPQAKAMDSHARQRVATGITGHGRGWPRVTAKPCWFGLRCKYAHCPYAHSTPQAPQNHFSWDPHQGKGKGKGVKQQYDPKAPESHQWPNAAGCKNAQGLVGGVSGHFGGERTGFWGEREFWEGVAKSERVVGWGTWRNTPKRENGTAQHHTAAL